MEELEEEALEVADPPPPPSWSEVRSLRLLAAKDKKLSLSVSISHCKSWKKDRKREEDIKMWAFVKKKAVGPDAPFQSGKSRVVVSSPHCWPEHHFKTSDIIIVYLII